MQTTARALLSLTLLLAFLGISPATLSAQQPSLVDLLIQQLGVTRTQAQGGAGAIFGHAKENLSPQEFGQVADSVPNMDQLLEAAPEQSSGMSGVLSAGSSLFGGSSESVEGLASLAGAFSQLGLSPNMVGKFVPVVLSFVQGSGGDAARDLLASALQ